MNYRLKLIFSGQPAIDDSITVNAQFIETFKASRTLQGETAIGADLDETILNLQNALIADYQGLFPFTTSIEDNILILNFSNYNDSFFDISINSSVITFELISGYFPYFTSIYDNKVDAFELVILGQDPTFEEENITATGILSYKDVDNILEPIRGAQLDINIDASIAKPFDLFLDIREKDFKAKLYRNTNLIFEGFVNPEGITQDYTSINWLAQLVAVDNLGSLKNTEHPYTSEVPSEFVFMDLALKKTGLDLPIAFFDDINQNVKDGLNTVPYLTKLEDPLNERLIEPDTFKNDNDRFVNCEDVILDILNKYNAILLQTPIKYLDIDSGQEETMLCWLFARPSIMNRAISNFNSDFKIKKITGYTETDGVLFPDVLEYNYKFGIPFNRIGTDGQGTQFEPLNAIHKNKNQLIRQTRATKAFRFIHKWISKGNTLIDYAFQEFEVLTTSLQSYFFNFIGLDVPIFKGTNSILFSTFNPTIPIENQGNGVRFVKYKTIDLPAESNTYKISAEIVLRKLATVNTLFRMAINMQILYTDLDGNRYYLQQPPEADDTAYTLAQFFIPSRTLFSESTWQLDDNIQPALGSLTILNVSQLLFGYYGNNDANFNNDFTLPPTPENGGTIDIYFTPLYVRDILFNPPVESIANVYRAVLTKLEFTIIDPPELGKGNYYDAENTQDVSSKIGEPIEIINADDKTDIFLNGLKRNYAINENYPYWTSFWNLEPNKADILELMSIERIRLLSKSQNIFSGDIHGYVPYFSRLVNKAYANNPQTGTIYFVFTKWVYDTADNTIQAEMMECKTLTPSVDFEKSVIFEDEDKKLTE